MSIGRPQERDERMEILRTDHLFKVYGTGENQITAVNDVGISVEQGEFVAVVGSSGSGKSTLGPLLEACLLRGRIFTG